MKRLILFLCLISAQLFAQTGIGTTTPNASAKLDVYSTNKGFLPPRVTLTSATDAATIASPAEGLLVYNLGSVGLQAGYYYWNGANWATIATATSAGNGVTASDMVKIYDGVGNAATINVNGATFSVTTSGKYQIDFSASATCGNCNLTVNFQVRDGANSNAIIASDRQTSYSNNVHAEYNGKVEVNLQAGRSYNVLVTTIGGGIYDNDYVRVYLKQVSGNLPVTGQMVDYLQASLSTNQTLSAVGNILFNTSSGTGITLSSGGFNLISNKTYKLEAAVGGASGGYAYYAWVDNTNTLLPGGSTGAIIKAGNTYTDGPQDKAIVYYTPTSNTTVYLRVYGISGTLTAYSPSLGSNYSSTWASIQQIGSSAIVNPWTLSGTNTYNMTGNVGIGTNAPTEKLEVNGNVKATNFIGTASSSTLFLLEAYANVTYSLPGSYNYDLCRYSVVNNTINVPSSWFNTSTYTFTPQKAGYWEIRASYDVYRNGEAALVINKNGADVGVIGAISAVILIVNKIIYLNGTTDNIKIYNSGFNSNSRSQGASASWFQARWIGE